MYASREPRCEGCILGEEFAHCVKTSFVESVAVGGEEMTDYCLVRLHWWIVPVSIAHLHPPLSSHRIALVCPSSASL
jgi:hypothetical protein